MRNPVYEQVLNKNGVTWEYLDGVKLSMIDTLKSLRNQARLDEPKSEELISEYALSDREGYQFPPLVVWRPSDRSKWILIDGNQRTHAYLKNGKDVTDVYIVRSTDPKVIDRLTWTFNNQVNGRRLTREECMEHAVTYVQKYGATVKEAAAEWRIPEGTLNGRIIIERSKEVCHKNNIKITPVLTDSVLGSLAPVLTVGEDLFCQAASIVSTSGLTNDEVKDTVREFKRKSTVEGKKAYLDSLETSPKVAERKAETKAGTIKVQPNSPREKHNKCLKMLDRLEADNTPKVLQPHASEYKEYRQIALRICQFLNKEYGFGATPVDQSEVG